MIVVGLVLIGVVGAWRLANVFPTNRARVAAFVVYAAVPLIPGVISTGRLTALVAYAAVPWFVHLLRTAVGIGTADPASTGDACSSTGIFELSIRERIRRTVVLAIVTAIAVAMAPAVLPVVALVAVLLGLGDADRGRVAQRGVDDRTRARRLRRCVRAQPAVVVDVVVGRPRRHRRWPVPRGAASSTWRRWRSGRDGSRSSPSPSTCRSSSPSPSRGAWRFTWAVRAALLVTVFGTLAVLQDRDTLPVRVPDVGVLLVPVALGLALSAAAAVASFGRDVAGRTFGWRQPAGVLSIAAVAIGVFPSVMTLLDGAWFAPRITVVDVAEAQLPVEPEIGDYRVLYLGDPRLLPVPVDDLGQGVSMAVVDDGPLDLRDRWTAPAPGRRRSSRLGDRRDPHVVHVAWRPLARSVRGPVRRGAVRRRGQLDRLRPVTRPGRAARRVRLPAGSGAPLQPAQSHHLREPGRDPDDGAARRRSRRGVAPRVTRPARGCRHVRSRAHDGGCRRVTPCRRHGRGQCPASRRAARRRLGARCRRTAGRRSGRVRRDDGVRRGEHGLGRAPLPVAGRPDDLVDRAGRAVGRRPRRGEPGLRAARAGDGRVRPTRR